MIKTYALLSLVLGLAVASASCSKPAEAACEKAAPECIADDVDFMDSFNEVHPAEQLKGKIVVLNFWATWCGPCKKEIPAFNRVYEKYKAKGVVMLGINTDVNISNIDLLNFQSDWEMTYPAVLVDAKIASAYPVPDQIPTTYIYNKHGARIYNERGGLEEAELSRILDKLVAE
jgi:thiol-disulfide isomerase/thioredoxin